ncbi:MAG TPA: hypothetical protein VGG11_20100 [Xanthobacteraceae bacterium]|jgi:hypothetical protein
MDQRDQEFLSKQLRHLPPSSPGSGGTIMLTMAAIFLAGVTLGALMFDFKSPPTQTVERTRAATQTAMSWPSPTVPFAR